MDVTDATDRSERASRLGFGGGEGRGIQTNRFNPSGAPLSRNMTSLET
jgi:hypothetical protein